MWLWLLRCGATANRRLQIFCDNKAVVDTLIFGRAKDSVLATCARNVCLLTAHYNIALMVSHVEGRANTEADLFSRWSDTPEYHLKDLRPSACWVNTHIDLLLLNYDL